MVISKIFTTLWTTFWGKNILCHGTFKSLQWSRVQPSRADVKMVFFQYDIYVACFEWSYHSKWSIKLGQSRLDWFFWIFILTQNNASFYIAESQIYLNFAFGYIAFLCVRKYKKVDQKYKKEEKLYHEQTYVL